MKRVFVLVLDSLGVGALPDAESFGDGGAHTLDHLVAAAGGLTAPRLVELGLGSIPGVSSLPRVDRPRGAFGRAAERSPGKDTSTGHWEMMGCPLDRAFPVFPGGFPPEILEPFVRRCGLPGVLGNVAASGTEILDRLGAEHLATGKPIVYTSADSVFQVAAHAQRFGLERLYEVCGIAREILDPFGVGRVIARPFVGEPGSYTRTPNRHDWSLKPRQPNYLTLVREAGNEVHGVGKIHDIFAGVDIDHSHPTKSNIDGIQQIERLLRELDQGMVFANLVETDMLWGHRNDPVNFHRCLQDFDRRLPDILDALRPGDLLVLTSDHGCDPTTPSTDHSREHALLLAYVEGQNAAGRRHDGEFADVGATVNAWLGGKAPKRGIPGEPFVQA